MEDSVWWLVIDRMQRRWAVVARQATRLEEELKSHLKWCVNQRQARGMVTRDKDLNHIGIGSCDIARHSMESHIASCTGHIQSRGQRIPSFHGADATQQDCMGILPLKIAAIGAEWKDWEYAIFKFEECFSSGFGHICILCLHPSLQLQSLFRLYKSLHQIQNYSFASRGTALMM